MLPRKLLYKSWKFNCDAHRLCAQRHKDSKQYLSCFYLVIFYSHVVFLCLITSGKRCVSIFYAEQDPPSKAERCSDVLLPESFLCFSFRHEKGQPGAGKSPGGGLKIVGQVEKAWLSPEHQGNPVIQTNSEHAGGQGEVRGGEQAFVMQGESILSFGVFRVPSLPVSPADVEQRCPMMCCCFSETVLHNWEAADQTSMSELTRTWRSLHILFENCSLNLISSEDSRRFINPEAMCNCITSPSSRQQKHGVISPYLWFNRH